MHQFLKFILEWNSTCFGQFLCPSSGVFTVHTAVVYVIQVCWQLASRIRKEVSFQNKLEKLVHLLLLLFFFFFFFSFFFLLLLLYNPGWVLVCSTILFHSCLSSTFALQPIIFILFRSSSTWSIHLNLRLPTGLFYMASIQLFFW